MHNVKGSEGLQTGIKKPGVAGVSLLFSITIILFILLGYRVQSRNFYSGIIISEFVLISLPALLFLIFSRFRPKDILRLNRSRFMNFFIIFWIIVFAIPLAAVFNMLNLYIVDAIFGKVIAEPIPVGKNGLELLLNIIIIAGSAGICEEFLFRGVIQRGFEEFGRVRSILLAAFLFSLTHLDFQKILGTFLLGALIGFIVYRTNSLYCGMFAHFSNNAIAVIVGYISDKLLDVFQKTGGTIQQSGNSISDIFDIFSSMPPQQLRIVLIIYGFMFIFFAIIFTLLIYLFIRLNPSPSAPKPLFNCAPDAGRKSDVPDAGRITDTEIVTGSKTARTSGTSVKGLLWLIPGLLIIGIWFYAQACSFLNVENSITELFKYVIGAVA